MNEDPVDWDGYRMLLAVLEAGSFSGGAAALGVSQPTVWRRVAALEDALGAKLLLRRSRGVLPTPAGEEVAAEVREMAARADAARRRLRGRGGDARVPVRISVTEGLGALWLPGALAPLRQREPELRLEVLVENTVADLTRRQADIAVRLFRPEEPDLMARKVGTLGFALFASPAYLARRGSPRRLSELARHDVVGFPERNPAPSYLTWLRAHVPDERFVFRASSLLAQHEAARAGFGVVVGTRALLSADPRLRRILPRARVPSMDIWLAVHMDVRKNPAVARVLEHLTGVFSAARGALA